MKKKAELSTQQIVLIIILIAITTSSILNKIMKGEVSELFVEIPPYRIPKFNVLSKKVWIRMKNFFSEAVPLIILGVLIINIMDILHITDFISNKIGGFIINFMGLPEKTISVMLLGFLRKDVSIAMLSPFSLSTKQFIIACIFMVLYLPCIASFFVLIKEMGIKSTLKIVSLILLIAIFAAALLNAVL